MTKSQQELEGRIKHFGQVCRRSGIKLTHQRLEIFREVARSAEHPGAESVFQGVRKRMPTISLDTVYRTLWLLSDLGLVKTLGPPREHVRFDANLERHHHFICNQCGLTRDFFSSVLDELELPDSVMGLGRVQTTNVEVRGVCRQCTAREGAKIKPKDQ